MVRLCVQARHTLTDVTHPTHTTQSQRYVVFFFVLRWSIKMPYIPRPNKTVCEWHFLRVTHLGPASTHSQCQNINRLHIRHFIRFSFVFLSFLRRRSQRFCFFRQICLSPLAAKKIRKKKNETKNGGGACVTHG